MKEQQNFFEETAKHELAHAQVPSLKPLPNKSDDHTKMLRTGTRWGEI